MANETFKQLEDQVAQLWADGQFGDAEEAIGAFITQNFGKPEAKQAEALLREGKVREKDYKPDPLRRLLELAQGHFHKGEYDGAVDLLKQILKKKPDHEEALDLIVRCTDKVESLLPEVRDLLQELPSSPAVQRAISRLGAAGSAKKQGAGTADHGQARAQTEDEFEALYEQGMHEYRSRHHRKAIDIFEELMTKAPEDSRFWRLAKEYHDNAQRRFDEGEVPADEIPFESLEAASKAKSLGRASKFSEAVKLLEDATRDCHEKGIKYPVEWDNNLDNYRAYAESEKMALEGEDILREKDDWSEVIKLWRKAVRANPEDDLLKSKLDLLQQTESAVARAESFLKVRAGMTPEDQASRLIEQLDVLRDSHAEFTTSKRVEAALTAADEKAQAVIAQLTKQADEFLKQARSKGVQTLAEKKSAAERAMATFDLVRQLGQEGIQTAVSGNTAKQLVDQFKGYEDKLKEANELIAGGDRYDEAETILAQVKDECPQDPGVTSALRTLQARWLDKAAQEMRNSYGMIGMGNAGGFLQRAGGTIYASLGHSDRLENMQGSWDSRTLILRAVGVVAGAVLFFGVIFFGYRGILVPYLSTPTPTYTWTPSLTPTLTATFTPTPAPTITPTPLPTPTLVGIPGKVTESLTFVYAGPDANTTKAGFVQKDQFVIIFDQVIGADSKTLWFHIRWDVSGQTNTGWIPAQFVQQVPK